VTKVTSSKVLYTNVTLSLTLKEVLTSCWTVIICVQTRHWMLRWANWIQYILSDTISRTADWIFSSAFPTTVAFFRFPHFTYVSSYLSHKASERFLINFIKIHYKQKVSTFVTVYVFISCSSVSFKIPPVQLHTLITILCYMYIKSHCSKNAMNFTWLCTIECSEF